MNKFDYADFMSGYLGLGAYCFDAEEILKNFDIDAMLLRTNDCAENQRVAMQLGDLIVSKYFAEFCTPTIQFDFVNKSTYGNIERWHSDAEYIFKGQNATINCFFDNTNELVGGRFDIVGYCKEAFGTSDELETTHSTYPSKNSIIVFNQNRNWMHKVKASTSSRRMISFAAAFHEFNPVLPNLTQC